ncbi:Omp28-related outer membrane protein [Weeksella sp. HMSC059D05]|uniref:T9SS type A sorting domain-containing protein n=1 Tax=Weeksella sp. HMSC059D05 TaxID=1715139 RepID=UPI0008A46630|nr:Omp28-related outer membrane protein [Weeksella sp. HMSC059D05]OFM81720.1 hypothetical protein HMPREF2660_00440 [Weeksella sp. HMSC059D05]
MKKKFTNYLVAFLLPVAAFGQTIVSTTAENKKVVLEEFTGVKCGYCPDGHAIAKAIQEANPGKVFLINIHQGGYANATPDFRTPYGNAIANQSGLNGYPSGTVNRHVFTNPAPMTAGGTALSRGGWTSASNQILSQPSYVNLGMEASLNVSTRELVVHVEAYYTGDSPVSTNKLNIAVLQNNTKGPQAGGGQGSNYIHMHRLIDLITGQWGEEITTTKAGSFVDRTFTVTLPEAHNNVPIVPDDIELVAFIAEGNQEIMTGAGTIPDFTGIAKANEIEVNSIETILPNCLGKINPVIGIKNNGQNTLTSLLITYKINGETHTYTWTGELKALNRTTIELPETPFTVIDNNSVEIILPDDEDNSNNTISTSFLKAKESSNSLTLTLSTDQYGIETSWKILNSAGTVVYEGKNYGNNQTYTIPIELEGVDCFQFQLIDSYGDGGKSVKLVDHNGVVLYQTIGNYGKGATVNFSTDGTMSTTEFGKNGLEVYPNPSTGIVHVELKTKSQIEVMDMAGRKLYTKDHNSGKATLDLSGFGKGTYVVKINDGTSISTRKVIIK